MVKRKSIVKQKQKQTQIVNINLGGRIRKSKPKKRNRGPSREGAKPLPAYNPPSIVNFPAGFNQPNVFQPLVAPPPQRQYAVFAEGENSRVLNTNPTIPVPFTFVGATEKLKAPPKEERLVPVPSEEGGEVKAEEEEVVLPTEAEIALAEAEAAAIEGEAPATAEEEASIKAGTFLLPNVAEGKGVEERVSEKKKKGTGLFGFFSPVSEVNLATGLPHNFPAEEKRTFSLGPKRGRPKGSANKPKENIGSSSLLSSFPTEVNVDPFSIPIQTAQKVEESVGFTPPLSALTTGQYEFIGGTKQPEQKAKGETLERRRGGGVITPNEQTALGSPPAFIEGLRPLATPAQSFAFLG